MATLGVSSRKRSLNEAPAPPANGSTIREPASPFNRRICRKGPDIAALPPGYRRGLAVTRPPPALPHARALAERAVLFGAKTAECPVRLANHPLDGRTRASR